MPKQITIHSKADIKAMAPNHKKPPDHIKGHCRQCGNCCEHYSCPAYNPETKRCRIYDCRPIACRIWPADAADIAAADCPGFHQEGL